MPLSTCLWRSTSCCHIEWYPWIHHRMKMRWGASKWHSLLRCQWWIPHISSWNIQVLWRMHRFSCASHPCKYIRNDWNLSEALFPVLSHICILPVSCDPSEVLHNSLSVLSILPHNRFSWSPPVFLWMIGYISLWVPWFMTCVDQAWRSSFSLSDQVSM